MPELDIVTKFSKTATPDVRRALAVSFAVARATAHHIRQRVLGGKTATRARPYSGPRNDLIDKRSGRPRKRFYYISPAYAKKLGLGDQTRWGSSAALHRAVGTQSGRGFATGGMWKGLQVRNFGREAALIEFARSSLGASSVKSANTKQVKGQYELHRDRRGKLKAKRVVELSRDEGGNVKYRRKPKLVRNSTKAGRVFKSTKVGLLQPTPSETTAQIAAVASQAQAVVVASFGSDRQAAAAPTVAGDRRLFAIINREIARR